MEKKSNNRTGNWKECRKCGKWHYCDEHHILPKGIFGEGETVTLCKNCHDKYHRELGHKYTRKENKQTEEFYFYSWLKWLHLGVVAIIAFALWMFFG